MPIWMLSQATGANTLIPRAISGEIALYGLVLNAIWEIVQLVFLYNCWNEWSPWQRVLIPLVCILGDVLIMLGVAALAALVVGSKQVYPPEAAGWIALLAVGFVAGVLLEWVALALGLWTYEPHMATLHVGPVRIGWSPILQITLLPAVSVYLASS